MKKLTLEQKKSIYCIKHGHSRIVRTFFGEVSCERCGEKIGDQLLGSFDSSNSVVVGHNCTVCNDNVKTLSRRDVQYIDKDVLRQIGYVKP